MKRILSLLLVISMILPCATIVNAQESDISITAPSYAKPGENVNVTVNFPQGVEFNSGSFNLVYDSAVLELVSASSGDVLKNSDPNVIPVYDMDKIRLSWMGDDAISGGTALNLIFKVVSGATGTVEFSIEKFKAFDENYDTVSVTDNASTKMYIINEAEMKLSVSCPDSATTGDAVTVTVDIEDPVSVCGGSFNLVYDAQKLSVDTVKAGGILSAYSKQPNKNYAENKVRLSFAGASALAKGGTLLTVTFNVYDGVSGTADFVIEKLSLGDSEGNSLEAAFENASMQITCNHSHMEWVTVTEATCTEDGEESYSCGCGYTTETRTIEKTGHKIMDWVVAKEATCFETGLKEYTCLKCGYVEKSEEIPVHDHEYIDTVVPPTGKDEGYTEHKCKYCETSYKDSYVPATGYTISFDANGGENAPQSINKKHGEDAIIPNATPVKAGYTFLGWAKQSDSENAEYVANGAFSEDSDTTLYAIWSINKHTVTYKVDGEEYAVFAYNYGDMITAADEPSKTGYTFSGWSDIPVTMPDNDVEITGTFTINTYTVTYDLNGGSGRFNETTVQYNKTFTLKTSAPTKRSASFVGWATKKSARKADYMPGDKITVTDNVTLYAIWVDIWTGGKSASLQGKGTKTNPYIIATANDLAFMRDKVNEGDEAYNSAYYIMTNNIVLNDTSNVANWATQPPKNEWSPICEFYGVFDGNSYTISGLYIDGTRHEDDGLFWMGALFGDVENGTITNLGVTDGYIKSYENAAALISVTWKNVTIKNCFNTCTVEGVALVGGLVGNGGGYSDYGGTLVIDNCYNSGKIIGYEEIGGIVGGFGGYNEYDANLVIDNCYNNGDIIGIEDEEGGAEEIGGIVGGIYGEANIFNCNNTGNVSGGEYVGGIVGDAESDESGIIKITNSVNEGNIEGTREIAGICGYAYGAEITDSKNKGDILCHWKHGVGIVGYAIDTDVSNCGNLGNITNDMTQKEDKWSVSAGICGAIEYGTIKSSYNVGNINASGTDNGGICGCISYDSLVEKCYNAGNVKSSDTVAGIAACTVNNGVIKNCLNTGTLNGGYLCAGITAWGENGSNVERCINIGKINSTSNNQTAIAYSTSTVKNCYYLNTCSASGSGTSLTAEQMRNGAAYSGFTDFNTDWEMGSNPYFGVPMLKGMDNLLAQPIEFDLNGGYFDDYVYSARTYAAALNAERKTDNLIIYNNSGASTVTNKYGVEVLVNSRNIVTDIYDVGTGNHVVPTGGCVLSGNGIMADWLKNNIEVGDKVNFDSGNLEVNVYKKNPKFTYAYGQQTYLPVPHKDGYLFAGWYDGDNLISYYDTSISKIGTVKLVAHWKTPQEVTRTTYNGNTYILFNASAAWEDSERYCEEIGGHLVTITSAEENSVVAGLVAQGECDCMIGANEFDSEGSWKWVTGEPFSYTNWGSGLPDNMYHCNEVLEMTRTTGKWNDMRRDYCEREGFICEIENLSPVGATMYNGHYYQVFDKNFSWEQAKAYCEQIGGHLATITSAEEDNEVKTLVENQNQGWYWLGATDDESEGVWKWITGEEWNYSHWNVGQPDNSGGKENCLHIYTKKASSEYNGFWNDAPQMYNTTIGFVCEFDTIEPVASAEYNGHTYKLFDTALTWEDARSYCNSIGGHLATVTSAYEQNNIANLIAKGDRTAYYLGGNDIQTEGVYQWITGEAWSYTNWGGSEPNNYDGIQDVLSIRRSNNTWNDDYGWFFSDYGFICEFDDKTDDGDIIANGTCGANLTWTLSDMGTLTISGIGEMGYPSWWDDNDYYLKIKEVIIENGTTSISSYAFEECPNIISVTIPDSVKNIGQGAFDYCTNLTSIEIPDGVTSIGASAFYGCSSLTSIEIPDNVTEIGSSAFRNCSSLTAIKLPTNLIYIHDYTFRQCKSLQSITIPDGVKAIGEDVFEGCSSLTSIEIPYGVETIGEDAFYECSSLTSIEIPDSVTYIDWNAFDECRKLSSVKLSKNLEYIGDYAFYDCALTSIDIPEKVTEIGEGAFEKCKYLTEISVSENNANYSSQDGVLYDNEKTYLLCCPGGKTGSYTLPAGVTEIYEYAFEGCNHLDAIYVPEDNPNYSSKDGALYNKDQTELIYSPNSLVIGTNEDYFWYMDYVLDGGYYTNIYVNDGNPNYISVDGVVFTKDMTALVAFPNGRTGSYTIPDSVIEMYDGAFTGTMLDEIRVSKNNTAFTSVDGVLFSKDKTVLVAFPNKNVTSYVIPDEVLYIFNLAFANRDKLHSVTIPKLVSYIGYDAFAGCTSLETVYYKGTKEEWNNIYIYDIKEDFPTPLEHVNIFTIDDTFYTLTFDTNGGENAPESEQRAVGKTFYLPKTVPTKAGYIFMGWTDIEGGTEAKYQPGDKCLFDGDTTLYAVWQGNTCTVTYNSNGGNEFTYSDETERNSKLTITDKVPTKENYIFLGWATTENATEPEYKAGDEITVTDNLILYAVWKNINDTDVYTIKYIDSGYTTEKSKSASEEITLYRSRTKLYRDDNTTKSIDGWTYISSNEDVGEWIDNGTTSVKAEDTDYRKREVQTYKIPATYKTQYHYYYYSGYSGTHYSSSSSTHKNYTEKWFDYELPNVKTVNNEQQYREKATDKYCWFKDSANYTREVVDTPEQTGYKYRDTYYTHHFWKWGDYSDWSETAIAETEDMKIQTMTAYKYGDYKELLNQNVFGDIAVSDIVPERKGYNFKGWARTFDATEVEFVAGDTIHPNSNITLYPVWEQISSGETEDGIKWSYKNGTLTISGTGAIADSTENAVVPWQEYLSEITKLVISDGITAIGDYAFYKLANVTDVVLSDSVKEIGDYAFSNCTSLVSINLEKVNSIGDYAFRFCTGISNIEISATTVYGKGVYSGCGDVDKVVMDKKVLSVGDILSGCHAQTVEFGGTKEQFEYFYKNAVNFTFDSIKIGDATYTIDDFVDNTIHIEKITLNKKTVGLKAGETFALSATVEPSNATNKEVAWKSSNENFVTVDENGLVTAVSEGAAEITCSAEDGEVESSCIVYVTKDTEAPVILSSSAKGRPGQKVEVTISAENNPGIVSAKLNVEYNSSALTLVEVKDGGILGKQSHSDNLAQDPYILYWDNGTATENFTENGTLATLVFEISNTASGGVYPITVTSGEKDIINSTLNPVKFNIYSSNVDVYSFMYGDVDDDDEIGVIDSALLSRFIGNWSNININLKAADVNNDSRINTVDSAILKRHIGKWTGYEVLPYIPGASLMSVGAESNAKINVSSVNAGRGDEVEVGISLSDNPGIVSMRLGVDYDTDALELIGVTDTKLLPGENHSNNLSAVPYTLYWDNGDAKDNITVNGEIAKLKFKVKDSVKLGDSAVTVFYDFDNYDIINQGLQPVKFETNNGKIFVKAKENKIIISDVKISDKVEFNCGVECTEEIGGSIAVALYGKSGKLTSLKLYPAQNTFDVSMDKGNADYAKVFWWSNLNTIMPLSNAERIEFK